MHKDVQGGGAGGRTESLIQFLSKRASIVAIVCRFNNKAYLGPRINCQILIKFGFSSLTFIVAPSIKLHGNLSSWSRDYTCRQTDR